MYSIHTHAYALFIHCCSTDPIFSSQKDLHGRLYALNTKTKCENKKKHKHITRIRKRNTIDSIFFGISKKPNAFIDQSHELCEFNSLQNMFKPK